MGRLSSMLVCESWSINAYVYYELVQLIVISERLLYYEKRAIRVMILSIIIDLSVLFVNFIIQSSSWNCLVHVF